MDIQTAVYTEKDKAAVLVTTVDGQKLTVPVDVNNRDWRRLQKWMTKGGVIKTIPLALSVVVSKIKSEAERRIDEGTVLNGVQFKCNEPSVNRVMGMAKRAEIIEAGGGNFTQEFTTEAGIKVVVNSALEATAIFIAASGYVGHIIAKSSALQASVKTMSKTKLKSFNAADDLNW